MTQPSASEAICAACSTRGTGRFCSNCGASLEAAVCAGCSTALSPGERFCHTCGRAAGISASADSGTVTRQSTIPFLPWIVAAVALVALLAFLTGNRFSSQRGGTVDAPQNALSQVNLGGPAADGGIVPAPDISQLSPKERADRLFKRVMLLDSQGKSDSVLFFAPMAISAFQMLDQMNAGQRYEMGRIGEVAGALPLAKAQADTILSQSPSHLLGLILASRIAGLQNRPADKASYQARLLAAYPSESAKKLLEYLRHGADIEDALAGLRR
jgi:hypothetical protein